MQLQDKTLIVQRAQLGAKADGGEQEQSSTLSIEDLQHPETSTILNVQIPVAAMVGALIAHCPRSKPTSVLQLMNMFARMELVRDDEYLDIVLDVQEEAEKYGPVLSVFVPRLLLKGPTSEDDDLPDSSTDPPGVGRVGLSLFGSVGRWGGGIDRSFVRCSVSERLVVVRMRDFYYSEDVIEQFVGIVKRGGVAVGSMGRGGIAVQIAEGMVCSGEK